MAEIQPPWHPSAPVAAGHVYRLVGPLNRTLNDGQLPFPELA
jgi:hypothetical protein